MRRMKRESLDDVFDRMQNVFEEFQELGRDVTGFSAVPVDIREEDGNIVVNADLPGVSKEDINLRADSERLEISAESSQEITEENEKYLRQERSRREFKRTVAWPVKVDPETVEAEFEDGVLEVTAEKEEDDEGRDIDIQ
ncbi:MAG: Hsp20/alpha crystallin family protein [Candidatus Nanohaloarchaea archaeon]